MAINESKNSLSIDTFLNPDSWKQNNVSSDDVRNFYHYFHQINHDNEEASSILDKAKVHLHNGKQLPQSQIIKDVVLVFSATHGHNYESVIITTNDLLISASSKTIFQSLHYSKFKVNTDKQGRKVLKIKPTSGRLFKYLLYSINNIDLPKEKFNAAELSLLLDDTGLYQMEDSLAKMLPWYCSQVQFDTEDDVAFFVDSLKRIKEQYPDINIADLLPDSENITSDSILGAYSQRIIESGLLPADSSVPQKLVQVCVDRLIKLSTAGDHQYNFSTSAMPKKHMVPENIVKLCNYWRIQLPMIMKTIENNNAKINKLTISSELTLPERTVYWLLTKCGKGLKELEVSNTDITSLQYFFPCIQLNTLTLKNNLSLNNLNLPNAFYSSVPITNITVHNSPNLVDTSALDRMPKLRERRIH